MKKILISLIIVLLSGMSFSGITYAAQCPPEDPITVTVTEKIPGACCGNVKTDGTYDCKVGKGFSTVTNMMGSMVKYFTFIAGLVGVLFIVFNGIMYSMGGVEQSLKDNAKKRIVQTLIGLTVLLLSGVILNLVAPWIYTA